MNSNLKPALNIYIPTYSRPAELELQLRALSKQVTDRVKVYVNDNASSNYDVFDLARQFPSESFVFSRNAANIGGNANIALAFALAGHADYLWILGDNDTLKDNAVETVLAFIDGGYDLIVIGQTDSEYDVTEPASSKWVKTCPGLISQGIWKSSVFAQFAQFGFVYHNSSFPHLAIYYATKQKLALGVKYSNRKIFSQHNELGGKKGDYSLSIAGMPLLAFLFERGRSRRSFLRSWLKDVGEQHFSLRRPELELPIFATRKLLWKTIPLSLVAFKLGYLLKPFRYLARIPFRIMRKLKSIRNRDI